MDKKLVDMRDVKFVLWEQHELGKYIDHPIFKGMGDDEFNMALDEVYKFAVKELIPINAQGDKEGVHIVDGKVRTPPCYKPVFDKVNAQGANLISIPEEWGGQGLPHLFEVAAGEISVSACLAFSMYMVKTGCFMVLDQCASEEIKKKYIPVIVTPQCGTDMCLTESGAGTALGMIRTSATKRDDGTWDIKGNKIFITKGDHDLVDNIVHLVLSRTEGAPPGLGGLSLFVVPKYRLNEDGSPGEFNNIVCPKVEEKMGLHGSATCELVFGADGPCVGELVGDLNRGLAGMFVLMNEARMMTGLQGLALSSAAYLYALAYAKERIQGSALENARDPLAPKVEIIKHADVRRMLLSMKSMVEGMRALMYRGQFMLTKMHMAETKEEQVAIDDQLSILTPIIKAYCSDQGFLVTKEAIQVFGGYGFCSEYPVEQYMRDMKIASLWEGCNGIQALDLIGRKVLNVKKQMKPYNDLISSIRAFFEKDRHGSKYNDKINKAQDALETLDRLTKDIAGKGIAGDFIFPVRNATEYLEAFGHMLTGYLLAEQLLLAEQKFEAICKDKGCDENARAKLIEDSDEAAFYAGKIHSACFFIDKVLPRVDAIAKGIMNSGSDVTDISERSF